MRILITMLLVTAMQNANISIRKEEKTCPKWENLAQIEVVNVWNRFVSRKEEFDTIAKLIEGYPIKEGRITFFWASLEQKVESSSNVQETGLLKDENFTNILDDLLCDDGVDYLVIKPGEITFSYLTMTYEYDLTYYFEEPLSKDSDQIQLKENWYFEIMPLVPL